jgi:cyclohexyl-isocyanide hydratase
VGDLVIGIPIYGGVDLIDVAAPVDVLSRIPHYWSGGAVQLILAAATCDAVVTGQNVPLIPATSFEDCPQLDVLLVPGAYDVSGVVSDEEFLAFLRKQAAGAKHVTAVCTGSIILAAAGLLDGYRATTHHLALPMLESYCSVTVANGYPRWVECGNRFTTGGVSASLDGALKLAEILTGDAQVARCIQLEVQYRPSPPFDCGDPAVADFRTYDLVAKRSVKEC